MKKNWQIAESQATPYSHYVNRRTLLKGLAAGAAVGAITPLSAFASADALKAATKQFYPPEKYTAYDALARRPVTDKVDVETYNNFYEFGSHKNISQLAQKMEAYPWMVSIDGECNNPMDIDIVDLLKKMPLQQRIYRHRCVEAWAMTVPWDGFPLQDLIKLADPKSDAKYIVFVTDEQKETMPGLKQFWYPWPYTEALTIDEAMNDLAFIATGAYGEVMKNQNGAPLRLAVPWKYGFKHIKSIKKISFVKERPQTFWEEVAPKEYGFWANVNPDVAHARWSQATERLLGNDERVPTLLYNGYAEQVAPLYASFGDDTKLFI